MAQVWKRPGRLVDVSREDWEELNTKYEPVELTPEETLDALLHSLGFNDDDTP